MTQKEPLLTAGSITTVVAAVLVFLRSFGVDITEDQQEAIRGLVAVLAPIILAIIGRQLVYAPATVAEIVEDVSGDPSEADRIVKA